MPSFEHVIEADYKETFRTAKVAGMFDVAVQDKLKRTWQVDIPCEDEPWNIGLIVGPSGSGKTTIGKIAFGANAYHEGYEWPNTSILDGFDSDLDIKEIVECLSHVGFSSPPAWLLPFDKLSNGQKFRVEMARLILSKDDLFVIDEFTSVVDRTVAKIGCAAIQKVVRRKSKRMVALSCHYDIVEWLEPDWIYEVTDNRFIRGRPRRPQITIEIFRCHSKAWELFKGHHYLNANINKSSSCYVAFIDDEPVAFASVLPFPHAKIKNTFRESRVIVLPDFQGIGIGNRLSEAMGELYRGLGKRYISTTSHPAMIFHRLKSKRWMLTRKPSRVPLPGRTSNKKLAETASSKRLTASFEYIG